MVSVLLICIGSMSFAQSVPVGSENFAAHKCYLDSTIISTVEDLEIQNDLIEACNDAISEYVLSDKDLAATFSNRGLLNAALGNVAEALADYNSALDLQDDLAQAYLNRGVIFHFERDYNRAISDYSKAIDLNVSQPHLAHFSRAAAFEVLKRWQDSAADYTKALEYRKNWLPASTRLSSVLERINSERGYHP